MIQEAKEIQEKLTLEINKDENAKKKNIRNEQKLKEMQMDIADVKQKQD